MLKLSNHIYIFLLVFLSIRLEIKAHDFYNGGCKNHCRSNSSNIDKNYNKIILKDDQKFIEESNSCLNNYLCRG